MTICIAAVCDCGTPNDHKIILCTDARMSSALGNIEWHGKQVYLTENFRCLTAGDESAMKDFSRIVGEKFWKQKVDETNIKKIVGDAVRERKHQLCDRHISAKLGITYDDFLKNGKILLTDDQFRRLSLEMEHLSLGASLVIAGFIDSVPWIIEVGTDGTISPREHFGLAGEARYVAAADLMRRDICDVSNFNEAIYAVFEAKTHAEKVSSVNEVTWLHVLTAKAGGKISDVHIKKKGQEYLKNLYAKYGPKRFPQADEKISISQLAGED